MSYGQGWSWVYGSNAHDHGRAIVQSVDTGFAIAGSTSSWGTGSADAYLIKTDRDGIYQWSRTYGTTQADWAMDIVECTSDSGFAMVGYTNGLGEGGYDVLLIRTDKDGNELWRQTYGGSDWDFGYSLKETPDSGFVICGETYSFGNGNNDAYVIKTDWLGDTLWTRTYGGSGAEAANDILVGSDASYAWVGYTSSMGAGNSDHYLVKTDLMGDTIWTRTDGYNGYDEATGILESFLGGYYVCGNTDSTALQDNTQMYIAWHDISDGSKIFENLHGGSSHEYCNTFAQRPVNGDIYLCGEDFTAPEGNMNLIKTNFVGTWFNSFNYGDFAYDGTFDMVMTFEDTLIAFVGSTESFGFGQTSVMAVKLDATCLPPLPVMTHEDITPVHTYYMKQ